MVPKGNSHNESRSFDLVLSHHICGTSMDLHFRYINHRFLKSHRDYNLVFAIRSILLMGYHLSHYHRRNRHCFRWLPRQMSFHVIQEVVEILLVLVSNWFNNCPKTPYHANPGSIPGELWYSIHDSTIRLRVPPLWRITTSKMKRFRALLTTDEYSWHTTSKTEIVVSFTSSSSSWWCLSFLVLQYCHYWFWHRTIGSR